VNIIKSLFGKPKRKPGYVEAAALNAVGKLDATSVVSTVAADLNATGVLSAADPSSPHHVVIKLGDQVIDISPPRARRMAEDLRNAIKLTIRVERHMIPDLELGQLLTVDSMPYRVVEIRQGPPEDILELHLSADVLAEQEPEALPEDKIDINHELNQ